MNCGWFSDRSACYLAAGRPVVLQDTGFADCLPTGQGLFSVKSVGEASEAIREIRRDYRQHSAGGPGDRVGTFRFPQDRAQNSGSGSNLRLKTMEANQSSGEKKESFAAKYARLGDERLVAQLRQNEELPPGIRFSVDLADVAHPIHLRAGGSDLWVFDQIFLYRELDSDFGPTPRRIIDAGANIGLASVFFANRFPEAHILALEVDKQNFELLVENVRPYPNITPLLKGLWNRRANLQINNPEELPWAFTVSEAIQGGSSTIEGIGVADLLRDFNWPQVDLLKMDIEGAELEVLSSGTDEWINRVRVLTIEIHYQRVGCWEAFNRIAEQNPFALKWAGEYAVLSRKQNNLQ